MPVTVNGISIIVPTHPPILVIIRKLIGGEDSPGPARIDSQIIESRVVMVRQICGDYPPSCACLNAGPARARVMDWYIVIAHATAKAAFIGTLAIVGGARSDHLYHWDWTGRYDDIVTIIIVAIVRAHVMSMLPFAGGTVLPAYLGALMHSLSFERCISESPQAALLDLYSAARLR